MSTPLHGFEQGEGSLGRCARGAVRLRQFEQQRSARIACRVERMSEARQLFTARKPLVDRARNGCLAAYSSELSDDALHSITHAAVCAPAQGVYGRAQAGV